MENNIKWTTLSEILIVITILAIPFVYYYIYVKADCEDISWMPITNQPWRCINLK